MLYRQVTYLAKAHTGKAYTCYFLRNYVIFTENSSLYKKNQNSNTRQPSISKEVSVRIREITTITKDRLYKTFNMPNYVKVFQRFNTEVT